MNTTPLKVLHINNTDLTGRRFNGFDLIEDLKPYNIECKQLVLRKESQNPNVGEILDTKTKRSLQNRLIEFETNHAYSKIVFPWADDIASHPFFLEADVVHYHLIHNNMLSTLDFARLTQLKPSVWTWHDPWPLTGHCIHPEDCTNWHKKCSPCPFLERYFSLKVDRSSAHWKVKLLLANEAKVTPIVASQYMRGLCLNSEIGKAYADPVVVPFGIKYDDLPSPDLQIKFRKKLGIPHDHFVLFFRCETNYFKGVEYAFKALELWNPEMPVSIITVGNQVFPAHLRKKYNVIQKEWTNDSAEIYELYSACDVFLMPSIAESFGLMAVEAMASGRTVVCFDNTALGETTHAPECGVLVPTKDATKLMEAINKLALDPIDRARRGLAGQAIVKEHYSHASYCQTISNLYNKIALSQKD